jgi:phosphoribosylamine--glycine ligase
MKILVIGGGGREHALAWKLAQSDKAKEIYLAPGNAGTAVDGRFENIEITGVQELCAWAASQKIALTVVGPEAPLAAGVVDEFRKQGLRVFGPTRAAAQLESSKAFSKAFMKRHGIPTAEYQTFVDAAMAHNYIDDKGAPIVVKADGLAAGKGVVVAMTLTEAHAAVDLMLGGGASGLNHNEDLDGKLMPRVVIEEFLSGEEASFIVMCDGKNVLALATSQDHKRLLNDDQGPNTGGMGAICPVPTVDAALWKRVLAETVEPTMDALNKDGLNYKGVIFLGLMITAEGPKILEYNTRFGDPETQVLLPLIESDFGDLVRAMADGTLADYQLQMSDKVALGVVVAAPGYPGDYPKNLAVTALPEASAGEFRAFHASTNFKDGTVITGGGRCFTAVALGTSFSDARRRAYQGASEIQFDGVWYRKDIGDKFLR